MEKQQTYRDRIGRFAAYIEARKFDPPRPLLLRAAALTERKANALDIGAGALNATKYLLSAGFSHVTALDASAQAQKIADELPCDQVTFVLSRFEDFVFPGNSYDLVNAEFSLLFMNQDVFPTVFAAMLNSVKRGGIFTGQLFGPNDSWNVANSGMAFHARSDVEAFFRGFEIFELSEENKPGMTRLGEAKHWHIFHIIARRSSSDSAASS